MSEAKGALSMPFTYANTSGCKKDRIFDPFVYRHHYDEDQLEELLTKYIEYGSKVEDKLLVLFENIETNEFLKKYTDSIEFSCQRLRYLRYLIEIVYLNQLKYYGAEDGAIDDPASTKMTTPNPPETEYDDENVDRREQKAEEGFGGRLYEEDRLEEVGAAFDFLDICRLRPLFDGSKLVNVSSAMTVLNGVQKIYDLLDPELEQLELTNTREQNKVVFGLAMKLAGLFDFLYGAMISKHKNVYYRAKESKILKDHLIFQDVEDEEEYWNAAEKGLEEAGRILGKQFNIPELLNIPKRFLKFLLGVASRGLKYKSTVRRIFSFIGWLPFYFLFNKKKGASQGQFFMTALNKTVFKRMNRIYETSTYKSYVRLSLPKVEVESKIYIQMPYFDELTEDDNLTSKKTPNMVRNDEDLPFFVNLKDYNSSEAIKMRVIATDDWGTIDWKTGELIDPDCEGVHLPVAILYVHGGGFLSGSSSSYQPILRRFARETGYPVFAVDYRLAPKYQFPIPLSDSFLAYLWLRYYSEKYMKVKFDKIILLGDSAGSGISFSLGSLTIRKNLIKPDGNVGLYPGFCCDRTRFTPSLLISIDEIYVNTLFIDHGLTSYVDNHSVTANYLGTPSHTPRRILKHMPPTRMGIAGIDPLRDSGIELFKDGVKAGVNCKGKVYKHFFHGYLEMEEYPFKLLECKQGFDDALEFINDIVELDEC